MHLTVQEAGENAQTFFFEPVPYKTLDNKQAKQILAKWGLVDSLKIGSFRFSQPFNQFHLDSFLKDLFSSPNLKYIINNIAYPSDSVTKVDYNKLSCTQLSTQMFDNLSKHAVVSGQYIQKTYGDQFQGIQICDKLRQCLLMKQSQLYDAFSAEQRKQLLFKVFQTLVLGGSLNQYEDAITTYLQWTKVIYKSVVAVRKQAESGNIFIQSVAVQIKQVEKDGFKKDYNPQNFVYVVVCPSIRTVHVLSNKWTTFW